MLYDSQKLKTDLEKLITYFSEEIKKLRTGRANAEVIGNVFIDAYGGSNKLNTMAQIIVDDAVSIKIMVWDKSIIQNVEKSLRVANLGGSVAVDNEFIRIKFNPLTEEDRKLKVKELNQLLEETRVKIRHARQEYIKKVESTEGVSEDDQKRDIKAIQTEIDNAISNVESQAKKKEEELLKV